MEQEHWQLQEPKWRLHVVLSLTVGRLSNVAKNSRALDSEDQKRTQENAYSTHCSTYTQFTDFHFDSEVDYDIIIIIMCYYRCFNNTVMNENNKRPICNKRIPHVLNIYYSWIEVAVSHSVLEWLPVSNISHYWMHLNKNWHAIGHIAWSMRAHV